MAQRSFALAKLTSTESDSDRQDSEYSRDQVSDTEMQQEAYVYSYLPVCGCNCII